MKIIYKEPHRDKYDVILDRLRQEFPGRKFRVIIDYGEVYNTNAGIEERVGFWDWRALDLKAMGLE